MAPRHMGQGSQLAYISHPVNWNVCKCSQACRMATTSACAVGSLLEVTLLAPLAMISPFLTMTAPKGPPLQVLILVKDKAIASRINASCCSVFILQE